MIPEQINNYKREIESVLESYTITHPTAKSIINTFLGGVDRLSSKGDRRYNYIWVLTIYTDEMKNLLLDYQADDPLVIRLMDDLENVKQRMIIKVGAL